MLQDLGIIPDGAVLIRGTKILAVGPSRRIENLREARSALEIRANGRLVMPGMIDSSLRLMLGGLQVVLKRPSMSKTRHEAEAILRGALQYGTLHTEIKAGGPTPKDALRELRHAAKLSGGSAHLARTWVVHPDANTDPEEFVASWAPAIAEVVRRKLAHFFEVEITPEQATAARRLFELASHAGMPCKLAWRGPANTELLDIVSQTQVRSISHVTSLEERTAELLSKRPVLLSISPGRELLEREGGSLALRVFLDKGGAIVLGSGYDPVESPLLNLQMSIALAVFRLGLTPEEAISAATINAAYASGFGARCGSLEYEKDADIILMNLPDYRELPRRFGMNHVGMVIRGGAIVSNRIGWKPTGPMERVPESHAVHSRVRP